MKSCWCLRPGSRPAFQNLVTTFSGLLERSSDYLDLCQISSQLELSQSLRWKENHDDFPPSSPPNALPVIQEQEDTEVEDDDEF